MPLDVEFTGLGDLTERLEQTVSRASAIENDALKAAMAPIVADAKTSTGFHDTDRKYKNHPHLRECIRVGNIVSKNGKKLILGGVFEGAWYGRLVEFGTSHSAPHPFLRPAYWKHRDEATEIIKEKIREALRM